MKPFLKSLKINNLLSFGGKDGFSIDLKPLNVLIGPNGSGKSNLIQMSKLLKYSPADTLLPFRNAGGGAEWIWKGGKQDQKADIEAAMDLKSMQNAKMTIKFSKNETGGIRAVSDWTASSRIEAEMHRYLESFRIYENLNVEECKKNQNSDWPNDHLMECGENLGLMLNRFERDGLKNNYIGCLKEFNGQILNYTTFVQYGTIQVLIHEDISGRETKITLPRVSNGTIRYMMLLAILLDPSPPPLICIEEPEIGLHPDIIPNMVRLLKEASTKTQLIVTTQSVDLVDALSDTPEAVVVCEKGDDGCTSMRRLDKAKLKTWLKRYSLGELWNKGHLGGNRW